MEMKEDDEDAEGWQEEKCSNRLRSGLLIYSDCALSLWQLDCSFLLLKHFNAKFPQGRAGEEDEDSDREGTSGESLIVSGMTGFCSFSGCLKEGIEAQLDPEGKALVRLKEPCPLGGLGLWTRSEGLGGQTGLHLISGRPPSSALLESRCYHPHSPSLVQTFGL